MAESLKEIKEKLQSLGISTDTPGIKGHDRREELANRLEEYLLKGQGQAASKHTSSHTSPVTNTSSAMGFAVPDMANLSMAELRSRLTMLGESTATPGLSGEDRRKALIKRLMESICGNDGGDDESGTDIMNKTFDHQLKPEMNKPDPKSFVTKQSITTSSGKGYVSPKDTPSPDKNSYQRHNFEPVKKTEDEIDQENLAQLEQTRNMERKRMSELGEAKKRLAALTNKRSMMISARFGGPMMDERLREVTKRQTQTESEILRVQSLLAKEAKKHPPGGGQIVAKGSSDLVQDGKEIDLEKLVVKLTDIKNSMKEKIKWHKTRIRCEEETNEDYGVEAENTEQNNITEINFEISKIKRQIDTERSKVGKKAMARWDLLQKEQQQQHSFLPDHTSDTVADYNDSDYYNDKSKHSLQNKITHNPSDDEDVAISIPTQGLSAGGGGMFSADMDFDDLDNQFNNMLADNFKNNHFDEESAASNNLPSKHLSVSKVSALNDFKHETNSVKKPSSPPKLPQKSSLKVPEPEKVVENNLGKKTEKAPASNPAAVKTKKSGSGTASDMDLDSFINAMDPKNSANKLNTDDDVLAKKLAILRQKSSGHNNNGVLNGPEKIIAAPSKDDSKTVPTSKPPTKNSPQKTVLTSDPKPTVSKKTNVEEEKQSKGSKVKTESKGESYRGEAEVNKMLGMNDDELLKKTKELEQQVKKLAELSKKNTTQTTSSDIDSRMASIRERVESKAKEEAAVRSNTSAPSVISPFDPKKVAKQYNNKNRPPGELLTENSNPFINKKTSNAMEMKKEKVAHKELNNDPWSKRENEDENSSDDSDAGVEKRIRGEEVKAEPRVTPIKTSIPTPPPLQDKRIVAVVDEDDDEQNNIEEDESEGNGGSEEQNKIDLEVKALRMQALELDKAGRYDEVEEALLKALELNPVDMRALDSFATFLHKRRGELGRAEAFFRRAIQVCVPSLMDDIQSPRGGSGGSDAKKGFSWQSILDRERIVPDTSVAPPTPRTFSNGSKTNGSSKIQDYENNGLHDEVIGATKLTRVHIVTQVLLHYATFLRRAKGDIEVADIVLRKAADISPTDSVVLGTCAHHLVEDNMSAENIRDATDLFKRALKHDPSNINNFLWYAKLLHKTGRLSEAELMFRVAMQKTQGEGKMGAATLCNYAMFLYKYKNKVEEADVMFKDGLEKHPRHKGLIKSYKAMLRDMKAKKLSHIHPSEKISSPTKNTDEISNLKETLNSEEPARNAKEKRKKDKKKKEKRKQSQDFEIERVDEEEEEGGEGREEINPVVPLSLPLNNPEPNVATKIIHEEDDEENDEIIRNDGHIDDDDEENHMNTMSNSPPTHSEDKSGKDSPSPLSELVDSRSSSRGSSRGSREGGGSSKGLKARLYERVNSAGTRERPLATNDDIEAENFSPLDEGDRFSSDKQNLVIKTNFEETDELSDDDLNDKVTTPDSFTEQLEKRGVITPHQQALAGKRSQVSSEEKMKSSKVEGDGEDSVEISFIDVTCYDIYMFHLRSTHGENIEADAANRISLYWTVKVYPDTYWEHETATQKVSDEKNSAIWRFPTDNDDSFSIKSNLHLCFLLFEATNDVLLGSAIFPGQDIVNAGMAGGETVYDIDDEIICEDGVTVIGQLQAKVRFVV